MPRTLRDGTWGNSRFLFFRGMFLTSSQLKQSMDNNEDDEEEESTEDDDVQGQESGATTESED